VRSTARFRSLPWSKRTQPIDNGTKHKLVVTLMGSYMKVKRVKRNIIFILKFTYSLYLATQIYTAADSSK